MRISTGGESHGKGLFAIIEGFPAGLCVDIEAVDRALARRQGGYGRGARQNIECDRVEILSGVRNRVTLGSPITLAVWNRDYETWKDIMAPEGCDVGVRCVTAVRPGHADLAGMNKFAQSDARNVLERASARETAVRVAAGEFFRQLMAQFGIAVKGFVRAIGPVSDENEYAFEAIGRGLPDTAMLNADCDARAKQAIDAARASGDTLGGAIELRVKGLKSGFGSCMTYREKLDARLASALMSVQAVKSVEVGAGIAAAHLPGSEFHDEIFVDHGKPYRKTNRAGGIEGGMSNGEELVLRAVMKPIPTLMRGLATVDVRTGKAATASVERSDVCAVPACEVVLESALCTELAAVITERLGGDTVPEMIRRYEALR